MRYGAKATMVASAFGGLGGSVARLMGRRTWSSYDLHAWEILAPLATEYLPWSLSAMRPSGVVALLNDISQHEHCRVVECGGGVSSVFVARLLRDLEGKLLVFEHDSDWADRIRRDLYREGIGDVAEVVFVPLAPHPKAVDGNSWYEGDLAEIAADRLGQIDLLSVDGPPAHERHKRNSRYPAMPVFLEVLAHGATVVLDDVERRSERQTVRLWEQETDFRFDVRIDPGGIAIGRRPGEFILAP